MVSNDFEFVCMWELGAYIYYVPNLYMYVGTNVHYTVMRHNTTSDLHPTDITILWEMVRMGATTVAGC